MMSIHSFVQQLSRSLHSPDSYVIAGVAFMFAIALTWVKHQPPHPVTIDPAPQTTYVSPKPQPRANVSYPGNEVATLATSSTRTGPSAN